MKYVAILSLLFFAGTAVAKTDADLIKQKILKISYKNMTVESNRKQVRKQLDHLTRALVKLSPKITEERIGMYSPGSWRQVWSDERNNTPGAPTPDLTQVYQVVSADGWGYNFGVRYVTPEMPITFSLGVVASLEENRQTTEIVSAFVRNSALKKGEALTELATRIHSGKSKDFIQRNAGVFPNGPIGAKAILTILYIDKDLKIGVAPNVYDGKSEMFVMHRQDTVH